MFSQATVDQGFQMPSFKKQLVGCTSFLPGAEISVRKPYDDGGEFTKQLYNIGNLT